MNNDNRPRILFISDSSLSAAHGTGTCISRNFATYPASHLFNLFVNKRGEPIFTSCYASVAEECIQNHDHVTQWLAGVKPDLIYSVCCGLRAMTLIKRLTLPGASLHGIPLFQHFVDLIPGGDWDLYARKLAELSPVFTEIWTITPYGKTRLEPILKRPVRTFPFFSALDEAFRIKLIPHGQRARDPRVVMLGNAWNLKAFHALSETWARLLETTPDIGPIEWHTHPEGEERVRNAGIPVDPGIVCKGWLSPDQIPGCLQHATCGIIPFNTREDAFAEGSWEYDYVHGSLPSRLVEYCAAGTPVILAGTDNTDTGRYICSHDIGIVADPSDQAAFIPCIRQFLSSAASLTRHAAAARQHAETCMRQDRYLAELLTELQTRQRPCGPGTSL